LATSINGLPAAIIAAGSSNGDVSSPDPPAHSNQGLIRV
jgi:hypothetical protein